MIVGAGTLPCVQVSNEEDERGDSRRDSRAMLRDETSTVGPPSARPVSRGAYLVVLSGPEAGEMFRLEPGTELLIGREPGIAIRLSDVGVSRRHACIRTEGDMVLLQDLGSHNGTFVGDERVTERALAPDDMIKVGANTVLK